MGRAVTLDVVYRGAKPRVDRTFNLGFDSGELTSEQMAALHGLYMNGCRITVESVDDGSTEAPVYSPTNPARPKSPSQALRQEMWAYFNEAGLEGDFQEYYEGSIDALVRHWHDKRMSLGEQA